MFKFQKSKTQKERYIYMNLNKFLSNQYKKEVLILENKGFVITVLAVIALSFLGSNFGSNTQITGQQTRGIKPALDCITETQFITAFGSTEIRAYCPSGYKLTGGTCGIRHPFWSDIFTLEPFPDTRGNFINCRLGAILSNQSYDLRADAVCCRIK